MKAIFTFSLLSILSLSLDSMASTDQNANGCVYNEESTIIVDYLTSKPKKKPNAIDRSKVFDQYNEEYFGLEDYNGIYGKYELNPVQLVDAGVANETIDALNRGAVFLLNAPFALISVGNWLPFAPKDLRRQKRVYAAEVLFTPCE